MNEKIAVSVTLIGAVVAIACGFLPNAYKHTVKWQSNGAVPVCGAIALFGSVSIVLFVFHYHANGDNVWWAMVLLDACLLPFLTPMTAELLPKSRTEVITKPKRKGDPSR